MSVSDRFTQRRTSLRRRRWFQILLAVLAAVLVVVLVWLIWFSSVLTVRSVEVSGQTTLTVKQIRAAAKVPLDEPLARADLTTIKSRVKQLPRIESVVVSRSWPHTVRIEVVERTAVAWMTVDGKIHGIDRYGVDFRTYSKKPKGLFEATVSSGDSEIRLKAIQAVADVAHTLRTDKPDWLGQVQGISARSQDSVTLDLTKGRTVVWGSVEQSERKYEVLKSLLTIKASAYDVSAPDQPTTKQ